MQRGDKLFKLGQGFAIQGVVGPLSFLAHVHQPTFTQDLHMVGKGRLGDLKGFQQLTAALFPIRQHFYDLQPVGISQGLADQSDVHFLHLVHLT